MAPLYLHPTFVYAVQLVVSALAVSKTNPGSWVRLAVLPFLVQCLYLMRAYSTDFIRPMFAGVHLGTGVSYVLLYIDIALLSSSETAVYLTSKRKRSATSKDQENGTANGSVHHSPPKKSQLAASTRDNISFLDGLRVVVNFRHVNTPQQVKNLPPHSSSNPAYTPSALTFLLRTALTAAISYLLIDLLEQAPPPPPGTFSSTKIPIFARIYSGSLDSSSAHFRAEIKSRAAITAGFWLTLYLWLTCVGSLTNFLCVVTGFSTPADCRPWFGPLSSIYTVRNFWGRFWHQCLRRFLTRDVEGVTRGVLGMRSGVMRRYVELVGCFALSGIMHELPDGVSKRLGVWESTGWTALRFFVVQGVGVCVEDAVEWGWRFVTGQRGRSSGDKEKGEGPKVWQRLLGYIWVGVFLVWSTPGWVFPSAAAMREGDPGMLPVSVIESLMR